MIRQLQETVWLEGYYQQRRDLSRYTHLMIPQNETREACLRLLLRNPTYPFHVNLR